MAILQIQKHDILKVISSCGGSARWEMGFFGAVGNFFSNVAGSVSGGLASAGKQLSDAGSTLGKDVDQIGQRLSSGSQNLQSQIDGALNGFQQWADNGVNSFENSSIGNNVVGHALGETARVAAHFAAGAGSGAAGMVTGIDGFVGDGLQYATDSQFRDGANQVMGYIGSHPGQFLSNLGGSLLSSAEKDPAHFAGQFAPAVVLAVATGGAGDAGEVASVAEETATAADAGDEGLTAGEAVQEAYSGVSSASTAESIGHGNGKSVAGYAEGKILDVLL